MTAISNKNIAHSIYLASKDYAHGEQSVFFLKVVQFLHRKRLLSKAADILFHLNKIVGEHEGIVTAKIFSKDRLDEKIKKEVSQILIKRYSGKSIHLVEVLDQKLLGGFKIEVLDEVMDLSIKNKMNKLQEYLIKSL